MRRTASPDYENLLTALQAAKPLLIGIDGKENVGKTPLSNWLGWQLDLPVIHLDLFLIKGGPNSAPIGRRVADLCRCIEARGKRPLIVEGVFLLDALDEIGRSPDFLIFVDEQPEPSIRPPDADLVDEFSLGNQVAAYLARRLPADRANFGLLGF
jgi:hypothetical protein